MTMPSKNKRQVRTIALIKGQYTPMPTGGDWVLRGPGSLQLTRYGDGRVTGIVLSGVVISRTYALRLGLKPVGW